MKHLILALFAAFTMFYAVQAQAETPHLGADTVSLSQEYINAKYYLPRYQSMSLVLYESKYHFPLGTERRSALGLGIMQGGGSSPVGKSYLLNAFDVAIAMRAIKDQLTVEVGVRLMSIISLDYVPGYDSGTVFAPYVQFIFPVVHTVYALDANGRLLSRDEGGSYTFVGFNAMLAQYDGTLSLNGAIDGGVFFGLEWGMAMQELSL